MAHGKGIGGPQGHSMGTRSTHNQSNPPNRKPTISEPNERLAAAVERFIEAQAEAVEQDPALGVMLELLRVNASTCTSYPDLSSAQTGLRATMSELKKNYLRDEAAEEIDELTAALRAV